MRRRLLWPGLIALAVAALCVRLGFWQLDRLAQRRQANARREAMLGLPALTLGAAGDTVSPWRHVRARGVYDHRHQVVLVHQPRDGVPGVLVATPLLLADGTAAFVVRGWMPAPDAATIDLDPLAETDTVDVVGYVAPRAEGDAGVPDGAWPLRMLRLAPAALAARLPYTVRPYVVRQLPAPGVPEAPRRLPPPAPDNGPHVSYAIQWFSFAVIALVGFGALAWRETTREEVEESKS